MASCSHGCTAAISAPGKWCYLLGELSSGHAADLLTYADIYAAHPSGAVLPSRRPESLRQSVVARLPTLAMSA
jgi:predicted metal-binding protein